MNKLFELFEAERPVIPDSNADYYIGYNDGLCMAQAIVLKRDVVGVVRCKDCRNNGQCSIQEAMTEASRTGIGDCFCSCGELSCRKPK